MRAFIRIICVLFVIVVVMSILPTIYLYVSKTPDLYSNESAVGKIEVDNQSGFRFIVFGDNHAGLIFNDSAALKLVRHMNREDRFGKLPIDFVLALGDVSFRGSSWDYAIYNKIRSKIKWPVISIIGNHDDDADKEGESNFEKIAGKKEFSFSRGNSFFIIIDNLDGDLSEEQFIWLQGELERSTPYAHTFIAMHKSPVSPYQQSWYRPELNPWSQRFMKLCEKYKVDIVFSGHEHMFSEKTFGGVRYVVSGGGGNLTHIPDRDGGYLHYLVVRVMGGYVDYEVRKIFPPLWEYLTYYMWKDLFYLLKDVVY